MEDDFRNLTAKVLANLDNPIKSIWFFKGLISFVYVALSGGTLLISVMLQVTTVQLSNGTVHKFLQNFTFHENVSSLFGFILRYVRAEMNVHAFMNELDQKDYWYPRKCILNKCKSMFQRSEKKSIVFQELSSCDITDSGRVPFQRGRHTGELCIINNVLLNGLEPKFAKNFTVG